MHEAHRGTDSSDGETPGPGPDRAAIDELGATREPARVECLADDLSRLGAERWTGSLREELLQALLLCLAGDSVRQDADAEDAICSTLERLGVMTRAGNLVFAFLPDADLPPCDRDAVRRYRPWLPARYTTGTPSDSG